MNYSLLTEQTMQSRLHDLPISVRNMLEAETVMRTVRQIARIHYLDHHRRVILEQLVGLTLMGFISLDELSLEISEHLHVNYDHASALAKELTVRIFRPIKEDLELIYSPITQDMNTSPQDTGEEEHRENKKIQDTGQAEEAFTLKINDQALSERPEMRGNEKDVNAPLILHEEKLLTEERKPSQLKSFSLPFGFFKTKAATPSGKGVRVRIEGGEQASSSMVSSGPTNGPQQVNEDTEKTNVSNKDEKRTVHYSEFRSALTPFDATGDIMNVQQIAPAPPSFLTPSVPPSLPSHEEKIEPVIQPKQSFTPHLVMPVPDVKISEKGRGFFAKPAGIQFAPITFVTPMAKLMGNVIDLRPYKSGV